MKISKVLWKCAVVPSSVLVLSIVYQYIGATPTSIIKNPEKQYDYIVVGAGSAGCVIASKLSAEPNVSVLLVEAGGRFNWLSTVPLAAPMMQGTSVDWSYKTEPQRYSSGGLINHQQSWPRGKGLGGSGQLNYLVHSFGRPDDYDSWPATWSYKSLNPYFQGVAKKMLFHGETLEGGLFEAFESLNASVLTGDVTLEKASNTIRRGARWSSFHAYLEASQNRENLHILTNTLVTQILINDLVARGVRVKSDGGTVETVKARREIILSTGAVNTPQLMMLSGVGPTEELRRYQIPLVKNLPQVGRNLFDHLNVPIYINLETPVSITLKKMQKLSEVFKYMVFGSGLLATNGIVGIGRANRSTLVLFGVASADEKLLKDIANFETRTFRSLFPSYNDTSHEGFIYLASCGQPRSRGTITLRSRRISDPPRIEPAYLTDEADIACTREAIKLALETLEKPQFRSLGAKVHVANLDDCQQFQQDYRDSKYAECVIRTAGLTGHHPGGTCKIGEDENDSVVDERLRLNLAESMASRI
ncbi:neither inactivation nor afterpotential protein G isoform X2 [Venturia canescens]|uniref:neither inactivation nor afterpotential protein G isoform X2 n=1 Tax=Venturia canescens TaxID=32260 RepID=UPI001C9C7101|nr:neither inactivation nor afterpotential protein G isoform X2 [Venturia canescens]